MKLDLLMSNIIKDIKDNLIITFEEELKIRSFINNRCFGFNTLKINDFYNLNLIVDRDNTSVSLERSKEKTFIFESIYPEIEEFITVREEFIYKPMPMQKNKVKFGSVKEETILRNHLDEIDQLVTKIRKVYSAYNQKISTVDDRIIINHIKTIESLNGVKIFNRSFNDLDWVYRYDIEKVPKDQLEVFKIYSNSEMQVPTHFVNIYIISFKRDGSLFKINNYYKKISFAVRLYIANVHIFQCSIKANAISLLSKENYEKLLNNRRKITYLNPLLTRYSFEGKIDYPEDYLVLINEIITNKLNGGIN